MDKENLINTIKNDEQIKKFIDNKEIIKTIYIEKKLINFIIKDQ
jgi:leucyl-tRNA synthetase